MTLHMLDTNTVSFLIRGEPVVVAHVVEVPMNSLCLSAITEGELRFGLAKRPEAKGLHGAVNELLLRIEVLPWDRPIAACYGTLRWELEKRGRPLGPLDLQIAAHALGTGAELVTNDGSFRQVPGLQVIDWTV